MNPTYGLVAVFLVTVATLAIGAYGWRFSRTTSDFFVASRSVRPALNASAIGGEYGENRTTTGQVFEQLSRNVCYTRLPIKHAQQQMRPGLFAHRLFMRHAGGVVGDLPRLLKGEAV